MDRCHGRIRLRRHDLLEDISMALTFVLLLVKSLYYLVVIVSKEYCNCAMYPFGAGFPIK